MTETPPTVSKPEIVSAILDLCRQRGAEKTGCPSEVARNLAGSNEKEWRRLMPAIRSEAVKLAKKGQIVIKRKNQIVDPNDFKGIYRLALPRQETPATDRPDEAE